ncbi:hypothetical protein C447_08995 [Halococcus hamelinensis 100A6]|uniref:ATP-grasp domain-containing protein n=1 Tax=Halococcus hamelinensis 100A6 TaxID=1132509 RepID=M0LYJ9_9EURY|nr:hypothetical protein C447_08995 [Halococcus hamelinensis 100A6]
MLNAERRQALAAIRSLGRQGIAVTAMAEQRFTAGGLSKYTERSIRYPNPRDHEAAFLDVLLDELQRREYDLLLAGNNQTVVPVVESRDRLEPYVTVPHPEYATLMRGLDKGRTMMAAREAGIPHPTTLTPDELDLDAVESALDYPVVVKPRTAAGRQGVSVCDSAAELERVYERTRRQHGPLLVQEFIPNGGECGVYVLYDGDSERRAHVVQRRLRTVPPEGGLSTYRETFESPELVSLADDFLSALDWTGVAHVEFRIDPRNGEPKLIEINPHFWHSLPHAIASGVDFPYLLYQLAVEGECETVEGYQVGVRSQWLIGELAHVLASENALEAGRGVVRAAATNRNYDIASASDPLAMGGSLLGEGYNFVKRRLPKPL